jgi:NADH-quinone oxidoreductase subunit H
LGFLPAALQPVAGVVLCVAVIVGLFPALFALTVLLERKGLGRIQNRIGPNRVGPFGILQPIADGIKSLTKEDIVPLSADAVVHFLAPVVLVVAVFMGFAVLPMGRNMTLVNMDASLLFYFAIGASTELSVFMAGWSSRNKYSLLGGMRAVAQMISYEVPLLMSSVTVVMIAGSLSLNKIAEAQNHYTWGLPHWYIFTPWGLASFVMYAIAGTAETNRSPFDLPEGESELVAGYFTEYSGFKFALFFLGEYLAMFSISGLGATLFLGGWSAPFSFLGWVPSWIWFFGKLLVSMCVFIWVRGTLPRLRQDQLMNFAWKFVLPLTMLNLMVAALWHFLGDGWERWVVCSAILALAYVGMAWAGMRSKHFGPRSYRYAE